MGKVNKMGYIFPKRIKDAIAGDSTPFGSKFYIGGKNQNDIAQLQLEKDINKKLRDEKENVLREATSPWNCPICNKLMIKKLDKKYQNRRGMCMDCTIEAEGYLRTHGLFEAYEKAIALRNYKAWMLDVKEQAEEFLYNLKDEIKVVNHDGTFDKLQNDSTKIREFIKLEIESINDKLKEVEDVNMKISAEEELNINLKNITKEILKNKEKQFEHQENN
jgi:hypothetical protein